MTACRNLLGHLNVTFLIPMSTQISVAFAEASFSQHCSLLIIYSVHLFPARVFLSLSMWGVPAHLNKKRSSVLQLPADAFERLTSLSGATAERHSHPSPVLQILSATAASAARMLQNINLSVMTALPQPLQSVVIRNPASDKGHSLIFGWPAGWVDYYLPGNSSSSKLPGKPPFLPMCS